MTQQPSLDKFANAVLFLLTECKATLGLTVLIKLLFRSDFEHYREHLRSITGLEYLALKRGPVPLDYRALFSKLVQRGDVAGPDFTDMGCGFRPMESYRPLRSPTLDAFDESELAVLQRVAVDYGHKTGAALSDETHAELPWRAVWRDGEGDGEVIPYTLARWEDNRCSPMDIDRARESLQDPEVQRVIAEFSGSA
jgi:uncharacterized phage-associated protein